MKSSKPASDGLSPEGPVSEVFTCDCVLGQVDFERYVYNVLVLPSQIADGPLFRDKARVRIRGIVNGQHPLAAAFQNIGGRKVAIVGQRALKSMGLKGGDVVHLRAELDDPERVDVPLELEEALEQQPVLLEIWQDLTAGKRRGFSYRVTSARKPETKARRVAEVLAELRAWDFSGGL